MEPLQRFAAFLRRNKFFAAVLAAETIVLLYLVVGLFGAPFTLTLTPADFSNEYTKIAAVSEDGGALQVYNDEGYTFEKEVTFSSAPAAVSSGAYEVTVEYFSCRHPDAPAFNVEDSAGSLTFGSEKAPSAVTADVLPLDDGHRSATTRLWISAGARLDDLSATLHYENGQLYLYRITLTEQPLYRVTRLFCFALVFAALDFAGWLLLARVDERGAARRRALRLPAALLGIALAACLPLFSNYLYFGHDLPFHLQRITAMAAEFSYGQVPVRMATTTLNGYGYANPLCYCELFLTLPALLYNAWLPLRTCYQVYVFAVTLPCVIFSYLCFARITGSRRSGLLGAALYTLSLYRLVCVYFRAAVGEYTAMTFLPLVLLGVYEMYTCEKPRFAQWAPLALGMAALVQCHLLTAELTVALLVLFCLLRLRKTLAPARLLAWCKAAALAAGLSVWFLLPFLQTTATTSLQVNGPLAEKPQAEGLYLLQLVNFFGPGFGSSDASGDIGTHNDMSLTLGLPLLLGLGLVLFCLQQSRKQEKPSRTLSVLRITAGMGLFATLLTLQVFPWDFIENWFGHTVGKLAGMFQFPWRFLSFAALLFCAAILAALQLLEHGRPMAARIFTLVLAVCIVLTTNVFYTQLLVCEQDTYNTTSHNNTRDVVNGEYLVDGTSIYETVWAQPKPASDELTVTGYEKREGVAYLSVENAGEPADISVPIFNYGHYAALDTETGETFAITTGENARIVLTIPAGYSGTISIAWHSPVWWRGCEAFSALCALGCLGYALYRRRTARRQNTAAR